jgi:hypothetical protein
MQNVFLIFGPDWILRLLNQHCDDQTALLAMRLLVNALSDHAAPFITKFR